MCAQPVGLYSQPYNLNLAVTSSKITECTATNYSSSVGGGGGVAFEVTTDTASITRTHTISGSEISYNEAFGGSAKGGGGGVLIVARTTNPGNFSITDTSIIGARATRHMPSMHAAVRWEAGDGGGR